jgi:hypothetical protein
MKLSKVYIVLFVVLVFCGDIFSQSTTNSPYSKYGVGLIRKTTFSRNFGMGGTGIGLRSGLEIGYVNPASYSALQVVAFDVGYTNSSLTLEGGGESQFQNNSYIDHLSFAFPVVKNVWGTSFGVLPFSSFGYAYDEVINDPIAGNMSFYNNGDGSINKVYWGNAFGLKLDSTSSISIGANGYFLFGHVKYEQYIILGDIPGAYNNRSLEEVSVSDFGADLGLQYEKSFINSKEDKFTLVVGATYGLGGDVNTKKDLYVGAFSGSDITIFSNEVKDTIQYQEGVDDSLQLPSEIGFGVSFGKEKHWTFALDYKMANWGDLQSNSDLYAFKSNYHLGVGAEIVPKYDGRNYFQRIAYRFGFRRSSSYLEVGGIDWVENGITFGIGLPVRRSENSYPRLNFGFEYGTNGTTDGGLVREKFFNMNIGITINATWFRKRKYD